MKTSTSLDFCYVTCTYLVRQHGWQHTLVMLRLNDPQKESTNPKMLDLILNDIASRENVLLSPLYIELGLVKTVFKILDAARGFFKLTNVSRSF